MHDFFIIVLPQTPKSSRRVLDFLEDGDDGDDKDDDDTHFDDEKEISAKRRKINQEKKEEMAKRRKKRKDVDLINDNDDIIAELIQKMKQAAAVSTSLPLSQYHRRVI